jgi:hypothetical protein
MSCPNKPGEGLCLTCRLGGLIRCPTLGTPLPLAEAEKPRVTRRPKIVWLPPGASLEDAERIIDSFYGPRR